MPEKLVQVRTGSLRRRLSALVATVMFVSLGVGLSARAAQAAADKVIVTFTFDDARDSQYPMLPIFATHGAKATFYVNSALMGTNGVMTWSQLRDLHAAGHEIGGHTAHHTPLTDVDEATARAEIEADVTTLQAQGFPRPVSFAYPIGYYGPAEEEMVEEAGYASGRTIDTDRRETAPPADPYAVRIVRDSLDGSEGLQALKNDVMAAEAASGTTWIVYLMHEFYSPIDEEIDDFLTWLGPRKASGTVVKTVRDVMLPAGPLPPVAEAGPDQTVAVGAGVSLDGSGSRDPNGDQLTYQWTQTAGPSVSLSSATAAEADVHRSGHSFHPDLQAHRRRRRVHHERHRDRHGRRGFRRRYTDVPLQLVHGERLLVHRCDGGGPGRCQHGRRRPRVRGDVGWPSPGRHRPGRVHPQGDPHRRPGHRPGVLEAADGSRDRHLQLLLERWPMVVGAGHGRLRRGHHR